MQEISRRFNHMTSQGKRHLLCMPILLWSLSVQSADNLYQVEINAPAPLHDLLQNHLQMVKWRDNPRMTSAEGQRLFAAAPQNIKDLLATEGYFSPKIIPSLEKLNGGMIAKFTVDPGSPVLIDRVDLKFSGAITLQSEKDTPNIIKLRDAWSLPSGAQFRQENWDQAKRKLLTSLLVERYPTAAIRNSKAEVNPETHTATLMVEIDSGPVVRFGTLSIEGLQRYPESIVENINRIKPGDIYNQSKLLTLQTQLQESGYFRAVEVNADIETANVTETPNNMAPIKVVVKENKSIKVGVGAGFSTNTGARTQLTMDYLNLLDLGWRLTSSLKLEQKSQSLGGLIRLPVSDEGYRDSISVSIDRTLIEGQTTTSGMAGVKRAWGPRKREQFIGANYLIEHQNIEDASSFTKQAATLSYGITLRRIDSDFSPTRGYMLNAQFTGAPLESLSEGRFLQTYMKILGYYPITRSTQLIARAEGGMVNGINSAPAAFLFRAGGDQSVRGYAYQSLGVKTGNAIVGSRYLATGSIEIIQWLTSQWGAAVFVDFGNAANRPQDLQPVYGYGLGARWKSPAGPIGADIAYGQDTGEYRLHFNIGVAF